MSHIPYMCNLSNIILWSKVSNAFYRSKTILIYFSFECSAGVDMSITSIMAYSVESPDFKPYRFALKSEISVKKNISHYA